jgi:hypothetical protein
MRQSLKDALVDAHEDVHNILVGIRRESKPKKKK